MEYDSRQVPGFPAYRVDEGGNVWTCFNRGGKGPRKLTHRWREKKPDVDKDGYCRVELYSQDGTKAKFLVHRLVLELFVGPCPEGLEGCHNDGNPRHNDLNNLKWGTPVENWKDRKRHGNGCEGEKSPKAKLTELDVLAIRNHLLRGVSQSKLSQAYGVTPQAIHLIETRRNWKHI
jgi:hypothetical protein